MGAKKKAFCIAGHLRNYDKYGNCIKCNSIRQSIYRSKNKGLSLERTRKWRSNPLTLIKCRESQKKWISSHPYYKALHRIVADKWRTNNLEKARLLKRNNEAIRRQRRVKFGQLGVKEFYLSCPNGFHVDHIIPLHGRNVSGLHVIWNLQYLTPTENKKKSNKFMEAYNG